MLSDLLSIVALGRCCEPTTITREEAETRKKITTILLGGTSYILLDNVKDGLNSGQLASALTAEVWKDRLLGTNRSVELPNRATWVITANNLQLSTELVRRAVRLRIDPGSERPWERTKFKHHPIRQWARANRPQLVHAALTLIQGWIAAGRPVGRKPLGSFESWAEVVGGILDHAGVSGFLEDRDQFYQTTDQEGQQWSGFMELWWEEYGDSPVTTAELFELADQRDLLGFVLYGKTERAQKTRLGKALAGMRDRRFGDLKLTTSIDAHRKVAVYRLVPMATDLFKGHKLVFEDGICGTCAGHVRDIVELRPAAQKVNQS